MRHERVAFIVMPRCFGKEFRMMAEILDIVNSGGKACRWYEDGTKKRCPIAEWGGACAVTKLFEPFDDNRPSWCPIKGEISEIELMHLEEERAFAARNIAAERKDDEQIH